MIDWKTTGADFAAGAWHCFTSRRRHCHKAIGSVGFTLIELLVVTAILGLMVTVIAASLNGGLRTWDEAKNFHTAEADAMIGLEMLSRDLVNTYCFADIPFVGKNCEISFPGLASFAGNERLEVAASNALAAVASKWRIGTVRYAFNTPRRELLRQAWDYKPGQEGSEPVRTEQAMNNVEDVSFLYRDAGRNLTKEAWQTEWHSKTNLPLAVSVTVKGGSGSGEFVLSRTVIIPLAEPSSEDDSGR